MNSKASPHQSHRDKNDEEEETIKAVATEQHAKMPIRFLKLDECLFINIKIRGTGIFGVMIEELCLMRGDGVSIYHKRYVLSEKETKQKKNQPVELAVLENEKDVIQGLIDRYKYIFGFNLPRTVKILFGVQIGFLMYDVKLFDLSQMYKRFVGKDSDTKNLFIVCDSAREAINFLLEKNLGRPRTMIEETKQEVELFRILREKFAGDDLLLEAGQMPTYENIVRDWRFY